jgi:hypothetical protein
MIATVTNLATEQLARNLCASAMIAFEGLTPEDEQLVLQTARELLGYYPVSVIENLAETRRNLTRRGSGPSY